MLIGYARVSKTDGSQSLDLQGVALQAAGVDAVNLYHDFASGVRDDGPGLDSCLRALRKGDVPVVWKLDRLRSEPPPSRQHRVGPVGPAAWACGCSPARARRSTPRPRPVARVRHLSRRWPSSSGS